MQFDIQAFLSEMRKEHREDIAGVREKVEETFVSVNTLGVRMEAAEEDVNSLRASTKTHGPRLDALEKTNATARWLMRASIVAALAFLFDMLTNHLGAVSRYFKP